MVRTVLTVTTALAVITVLTLAAVATVITALVEWNSDGNSVAVVTTLTELWRGRVGAKFVSRLYPRKPRSDPGSTEIFSKGYESAIRKRLNRFCLVWPPVEPILLSFTFCCFNPAVMVKPQPILD